MKKYNLFLFLISMLLMITLAYGASAQARYIVKITLRNGEQQRGELIRATKDSMTLLLNKKSKPIRIGVAEVESIRIRRKGSYGRGAGLGAGIGGIFGAIIGFASYTPPDCSNTLFCFDFGPEADAMGGGLLGAVAGSAIGIAVATTEKEFKIEGSETQFNAFANQYRFVVTPHYP